MSLKGGFWWFLASWCKIFTVWDLNLVGCHQWRLFYSCLRSLLYHLWAYSSLQLVGYWTYAIITSYLLATFTWTLPCEWNILKLLPINVNLLNGPWWLDEIWFSDPLTFHLFIRRWSHRTSVIIVNTLYKCKSQYDGMLGQRMKFWDKRVHLKVHILKIHQLLVCLHRLLTGTSLIKLIFDDGVPCADLYIILTTAYHCKFPFKFKGLMESYDFSWRIFPFQIVITKITLNLLL